MPLPKLEDIKKRRNALNIKQDKLAEEADVTRAMISKIENGHHSISYRKAAKIFDYLETREIRDMKDKKTDPAVVVIDDKSQFVISTLSGHLGGANTLARLIASILNAIPVITTAADVNETIAVDLLGKEFGWVIDDDSTILEQGPLERVSQMGELMSFQHDGFWQCMDTKRDRDALELLWESDNAPWKV